MYTYSYTYSTIIHKRTRTSAGYTCRKKIIKIVTFGRENCNVISIGGQSYSYKVTPLRN